MRDRHSPYKVGKSNMGRTCRGSPISKCRYRPRSSYPEIPNNCPKPETPFRNDPRPDRDPSFRPDVKNRQHHLASAVYIRQCNAVNILQIGDAALSYGTALAIDIIGGIAIIIWLAVLPTIGLLWCIGWLS